MNNIKSLLIVAILLLTSVNTFSQQVFIDEDFEGNHNWTWNQAVPFLGTVSSISNTFVVNDVYLGGAIQIGVGIINIPNTSNQGYQPNSNYLHTVAINALNGIPPNLPPVPNTNYVDQFIDGVNQELICAVTPDYSTIGYEDVDVSYWWFSGSSETPFGTLVFYSIDQGTNWVQIDGPISANNTWQQANIPLNNAIDNQPNVRFAFVFNNELEDNILSPPPVWNEGVGFGLDDFQLIAKCEFSLDEDYTVCSGETTTIYADTTWYNDFNWSNGTTGDSTSLVITQDTLLLVEATNEYCTITDSINIFVQNERAELGLSINGEVNGVGIPCHGDCNGELQLEVINGTAENDGSYTVQWLDSLQNPINSNVSNEVLNNFTSTLSLICEGKYYVQVLDAVCTVPEIDSIEIFSNEPIINAFDFDSVSCYNGSDGSIMSVPSGGIAPYSFNWGAYGTTQSISSLPIGTYTVVVTDSVGCSEDFSFEVEQPNQLIVDAFIEDEISCYGQSDGVLSANIYGGVGNYTFVWSHPNYPWVDDPQYNTQTLSNLPFSVGADDIEINPNFQSYSDPYLVTVTDSNGCQSQSEIYLVEPPKLELFLTQPTLPAYCNNNLLGFNTGWAQVSASGGVPNSNDNYNFVWSVIGQTDEDVLFSQIDNMNAGTYDVTVVDSRLCADQLTVEIGLENTWQSFTSTTSTTCFGYNDGSVSITMEGGCGDVDNSCGFSYVWNGGAATGNLLSSVDNLQQGVYSVTVTDDFGCEGVYSLVVDGPDRVDFQLTDLVHQSCFSVDGSSDDGQVDVEIIGGSAPYTVSWNDMNASTSNNGTTSDNITITGLTSSLWEIQITDANGCNGTYDLTSLHPNPFTILDGIEVTSQINLSEVALTDTINCYGASNAIASVLNPNPSFHYTWHLENSSVILDEGTTTTTLPAGNIQLTANYLDLCTASSSPVTIVERQPFVLQNNSSIPSCHGLEDAQISISVTGATPYPNDAQLSDYNFSWFPGSLNGLGVVNTNGSLDLQIPDIDGGTYYLEVVDRYGCDTVFSINLEDPLVVIANINSTDLDCHQSNGAPNGTIDIVASGGTTPYADYHITSTNSNNSGNFTGLTAGTYQVFVIDDRGCQSDVSTIVLSQPSPLLVTAVANDVDCDGNNTGEIIITANGGVQPYDTYSISSGAFNDNNTSGVFSQIPAGNYTFEVEDDNGCVNSDNITVDSPPSFSTPSIVFADPSCFEGQDGFIDLTVSGGTAPFSYDWSNGENTEDIEFLSSGSYSVTITDENGCEIMASQTLTDPAQIIADWVITTPGANGKHHLVSKPAPFNIEFIDISQNSDSSLNQYSINNANQTSNFFNGFEINSHQHTFYETGEYEVVMEVFNPSGSCSDTISMLVSVQGIIEYNAFSPNGDNINDEFYFENYGITELNAIIYNRWGDKIFEINNPADTWNGISMNGLEVPEGVYFYVLNAKGEDGTPYAEKGSVTLYR